MPLIPDIFSQKKLSEFDIGLLEEVRQIDNGMLWILQAIAVNEIHKGKIKPQSLRDGLHIQRRLKRNSHRLEEIYNKLSTAQEASIATIGTLVHTMQDDQPYIYLTHEPTVSISQTLEIRLIAYFSDLVQETLSAREMLHDTDILMIAGQQGVGKGRVTEALKQAGYKVVSMSQIVKDVAAIWDLDQNQTEDKIVAGQILKEYFGPEILVYLGVYDLISRGYTKLVIDGPRLPQEAQAVIKMGGSLIGVVADDDPLNDRTIRFERISCRSLQESARARDAENFNAREAIEYPGIEKILQTIKPEFMIKNSNTTSRSVEHQLLTLLANHVDDKDRPKGFTEYFQSLFTHLRRKKQ